mmetsp:Transcript_17353/g.44425  ORF Transcript_17353/g.44425 Transcript_17353/m.44425 type:complete len:205 (-) Transcript_17353:3544-4158(-)
MMRNISSRCATTASSVRSQLPMKTGWCVSCLCSMLLRLSGSSDASFSSVPFTISTGGAGVLPPNRENFFLGASATELILLFAPFSPSSMRMAAFLVSLTGAASSRFCSSTSMVRVTVSALPSAVNSSRTDGPENQFATIVAEEPSGSEAVDRTDSGTCWFETSFPLMSSTLETQTRTQRSTGYFCACPCASLISKRRLRPCLSV